VRTAATLAGLLRAVLFDWNNTLVRFEWDEELVAPAHRAALGRDDPEFTARWRAVMFGDHGYRPYAELLAELGVGDPDAFIDAEHEAWRPAHEVLASARALLDSLRARGLRTAVVANAWPDPARVLRRDLQAFGLDDCFDVAVFSEEIGLRKPSPEIFRQVCEVLGVDPVEAMFVGDDLVADVQGAGAVGMTTVQALWFRADDTPGIEADFMAFTPMDVLNAVRRLAT
jgi:putative hydrolase of the HAD superfamily